MTIAFRPMMPALLLLLLLVTPGIAAADSFRWLDDGGKLHSLDEYHDKAVIVHIWASWCSPCRAEMPELSAWLQAHPDVVFLPVSVDDSASIAGAFLEKNNIDLPLLLTDNQEASGLGVRVLPSTFVIAGNGEVKQRLLGAQSWADEAFSSQLLGELVP
jgi:thiol-disulfide isomerase/thioredoxin